MADSFICFKFYTNDVEFIQVGVLGSSTVLDTVLARVFSSGYCGRKPNNQNQAWKPQKLLKPVPELPPLPYPRKKHKTVELEINFGISVEIALLPPDLIEIFQSQSSLGNPLRWCLQKVNKLEAKIIAPDKSPREKLFYIHGKQLRLFEKKTKTFFI